MNSPPEAIPPERARQFDLIEQASKCVMEWAALKSLPLLQIEPVVPFVDDYFSLDAWLFVDTEAHAAQYRSDGTEDTIAARFRSELKHAGYPLHWLELTTCHFASKEIVDRDFEGSYFYFLR
jgi:hypothetical protein